MKEGVDYTGSMYPAGYASLAPQRSAAGAGKEDRKVESGRIPGSAHKAGRSR